MEDLSVVAVLDCQTDLSEQVKHLLLAEVLQHARLLFVCVRVLDLGLQIPVISVVHDDA